MLSIGIVGLPNVGKSTLFKILTKQEVNIQNYPFTTINPNVAVVPVKDERLDAVAKISKPEKILPAVVEFYDIAGLVKNAYKGEGLGNQFLAQIRETNAIIEVVRCFEEPTVAHLEGTIDPLRDIDIINTELIFKDLETVEKRMEKISGEAKAGIKESQKEMEILNQVKNELENGNLLFSIFDSEFLEEPSIKNLNLLTVKKQIYLLNINQASKEISQTVLNKIKELKAEYFIADLNQNPDLSNLIKKAYEILNLISFFTIVGTAEARAWPIKKGAKIIEAAEMIHSDFKEKFIKAEVINWQKLVEVGDWQKAHQKGLVRTEGRDYIVEDGDVIIIKHH
ncbi:MAG TPA: redox-regulated ATPase YchF [Candidatus Paceibacterota bacterium]|nr:redox-regulated ATPase YchF [Candidatus Paceibacterota bacterium]HOK97220.1 redox-regulated ATPase YchF [Candidatus Paceibacterota bacterium]HPP64589.1 redox-regulated ATPase YchF [Candidatus Paceibacterota bacterium]